MNVLFICNQGIQRSTTAADTYREYFKTDFGGLYHRYFEEGQLEWADVVVVMEARHVEDIKKRYPEQFATKKIFCLDIPDEYDYMQEELVNLIKEKMKPVLSVLNVHSPQ